MKRTPLKRSGFLRRYRPKPVSNQERLAAECWRNRVRTNYPPLTSITETADDITIVHSHHLILESVLRAHAKAEGVAEWVLAYDERIGYPCSKRRHERYHSHHERILWAELHPRAQQGLQEFLSEWPGLRPWTERHLSGFPRSDLDATYPGAA